MGPITPRPFATTISHRLAIVNRSGSPGRRRQWRRRPRRWAVECGAPVCMQLSERPSCCYKINVDFLANTLLFIIGPFRLAVRAPEGEDAGRWGVPSAIACAISNSISSIRERA
ncbi:hypothetical protein EVAR_64732_1 [Eumeta japonica]|uniref:Uncharacterized protein n=1 Tax=Eumeta variegata TaxID=151549 RepID=A0A4C1Z7Y9_EUMVA|nr:hypothetical protein EVAR_64732_1 [Eumeta japonica]